MFTTGGNDAIIDWILVELRDPQIPGGIIATRAPLVQRDGDVLLEDGITTSLVTVGSTTPNNIRVEQLP